MPRLKLAAVAGAAAALVVALMAGAAVARTDGSAGTVTFKAKYSGNATVKVANDVADISATGTGTGVPIGAGKITGTGTGDASKQPCVPWTGTGVMTGAKSTAVSFKILPGSQGCGDEKGEVFSIVGKATVTNATGTLAGATGTLKVTGVYDRGAGTFLATFSGKLTTGSAVKPKVTTLAISANPRGKLAYTKKTLTAPAGKIKIVMKNPSSLPHNVALRNGTSAKSKLIAKGKVVGKGKVSTVVKILKKGKYRYVCTVPGHEAGGMWGILTVK